MVLLHRELLLSTATLKRLVVIIQSFTRSDEDEWHSRIHQTHVVESSLYQLRLLCFTV